MRIPRPSSIRSLVLLGFGVVIVPFMFAVGYAMVSLERLGDQSRHAVHQAVQATQTSRNLLDQISRMERSERQYLILKDPDLQQAYHDTHKAFQKTGHKLLSLSLDQPLRGRVDRLVQSESQLYGRLTGKSPPTSDAAVADAFDKLRIQAEKIFAGSNRLIDQETRILQETASSAQHVMIWLVAALAPVVLAAAAGFTVTIARPIRQMDRAIRRMGEPDFEARVEVSGPRDLEYLGQRLDWLRRQLRQVERQKTRFLQHVSHELKTPLSNLREGIGLLNEQVAGPLNDDQEEIVGILQGNIAQLQHLIEDLLNFSTVYLRKPELNATRFELAELVSSVVQAQKPGIMSKSIDVSTELEPVWVWADREKLRLVVDNLLSNAVKYTPDGGGMRLRLHRHHGWASLDVIDGGPGIEPDDRAHVFDAFYQGANRPEGATRGTGLGLSIVREYVALHGGSTEVMDTPAGTGAHLRVWLPLESDAGEAA
ncbi:MAG TPA: ATP-binding protein [Gammaproteobacteria bacterium]|nr:ATP-binding protein [Gammaproteobacteria bacterium]